MAHSRIISLKASGKWGIAPMEKVIGTATVENVFDWLKVKQGLLSAASVRRIEVNDAVVNTRATTVALPSRYVAQLGLHSRRTCQARTDAGPVMLRVFEAVRLIVQGRDWTGDVVEVPDDNPVQIGRIALAGLDLVLDSINQRLIGNPAHGGEPIIELY
jgi:hypothetical protein